MSRFMVGSLVRCREREWVVMPSADEDLLLLRPLSGSPDESAGIYLPLNRDLIEATSFAPPNPTAMGDLEAGALLRDAARLNLRSGAGPFRSLGHLQVRPRPYQLVPLIMALRLDPVRLLIADDVGIGKTIEAGMIARELLDRGEIARLVVLCPPHLCDQWQRELRQKFALEAMVVRSSSATMLERLMPRGDGSVWEQFPITVASIDYVKSKRRRDSFLRNVPDLVIVDEAHAAIGASGAESQQQRYELVRDLAAQEDRHLILLTATPHSGIEDAFTSLIGLLRPRFASLDLADLADTDRDELARHFVQRRRADVQRWLGANDVTPFPVRESVEVTYTMPRSSAYRRLFDDVFSFTKELMQASDAESDGRLWLRRARYWAALALLRCVMSSPAAAEKALRLRAAGAELLEADGDGHESELLLQSYVYDSSDQEGVQDQVPTTLVEQASPPSARARLNQFAARAAELRGNGDPKLQRLVQLLNDLLHEGYNPIIYCRYIATADYLVAELRPNFTQYPELTIISVTGERSEEERELMIEQLEASPRRMLVATDCLSEGINLQGGFDAVVHYDLPWNPNRLDQREGRVDRYGQRRPTVRTALLYGQDNPMDEAVMRVLLRKAVRIHQTLGISVPLPVESGTVVETLIATLFQPTVEQLTLFDTARQMTLLDAVPGLQEVDLVWDRAVDREKESRTRFAQRRIRPEEVARELEESSAALGDAAAVERFVSAACARLGAPLSQRRNGVLGLNLRQLPAVVAECVTHRASAGDELLVSFADPAPEGAESLGRNHPLVTALTEYLLAQALEPEVERPVASRSSVIQTTAVQRRTRLFLLRVRMLIERDRQRVPILAEELVVTGLSGQRSAPTWLSQDEALALLEEAKASANLTRDERTIALRGALDELPELQEALQRIAAARAVALREAHMRVRAQIGGGSVRVRHVDPPDLLGLYLLLPARQQSPFVVGQ